MIGTFGPLIFSTSSVMVLHPNNISRSISSRWAKHDTFRQKPKSEFKGADLQSLKFDIELSAVHGVRPRAMLELLEVMAESGLVYDLVIGGRPVGRHLWKIVSVSEAWGILLNHGELYSAKVTVTLEEYV